MFLLHSPEFEKSDSSDIKNSSDINLTFVKLRKLNFGFFVTLDLLGNGMIPKSKIWVWHAVAFV